MADRKFKIRMNYVVWDETSGDRISIGMDSMGNVEIVRISPDDKITSILAEEPELMRAINTALASILDEARVDSWPCQPHQP